jgi:hypothetical protein
MIIIFSNTNKYEYDSYDIYRSLIRDYLLKHLNYNTIKLQMLFRHMKSSGLYAGIQNIGYPKFKSLCINLPKEYNDVKINKRKNQYYICINKIDETDIDNESIFKVFSSGNVENINYLLNNYDFDINMINNNNESLMDVLPYDKELINIYYSLFYKIYNKKINSYKNEIDMLEKENYELKNKTEKQKYKLKNSYYLYFLIIFVLIINILFFRQNNINDEYDGNNLNNLHSYENYNFVGKNYSY